MTANHAASAGKMVEKKARSLPGITFPMLLSRM
jgi:hypothetical protein